MSTEKIINSVYIAKTENEFSLYGLPTEHDNTPELLSFPFTDSDGDLCNHNVKYWKGFRVLVIYADGGNSPIRKIANSRSDGGHIASFCKLIADLAARNLSWNTDDDSEVRIFAHFGSGIEASILLKELNMLKAYEEAALANEYPRFHFHCLSKYVEFEDVEKILKLEKDCPIIIPLGERLNDLIAVFEARLKKGIDTEKADENFDWLTAMRICCDAALLAAKEADGKLPEIYNNPDWWRTPRRPEPKGRSYFLSEYCEKIQTHLKYDGEIESFKAFCQDIWGVKENFYCPTDVQKLESYLKIIDAILTVINTRKNS